MAKLGRPRRQTCRGCGNPHPDREGLNQKGYCLTCAIGRQVASAEQMQAREGPHYDKWRQRMAEVGQRYDT